MRRILPALLAAVFAAVTFSAYAADQSTQGTQPPPQKHAKKKKKSKPADVSSKGHKMDQSGQGAPQSTGGGGVQSSDKGAYQSGRGAPQSQGGGAVTSPTPTGPGRADNQ